MSIYAAMFHHFHDDNKHIQGQGSINAETFRNLLHTLQTQYKILHPLDYAKKIRHNSLSTNEICLTFDDALKCQIDIALPVLQELNLNAFFFVYSEAFYGPPDHLEIFRDFRNREFTSIDFFYAIFFHIFECDYPNNFISYQTKYPLDYLDEFPFYTDMDRRFRFVRDNIITNQQYVAVMFSMMEEAGYALEEHSSKLFMTTNDLQLLVNSNNIIGLHSDSHPTTLDQYSFQDQWKEYSQNKTYLEKITGVKIWAMSHPCGRYTDDTLKVLYDLQIDIGFRSSLSVPEIRSSLEIPREDHSNLLKDLTHVAQA